MANLNLKTSLGDPLPAEPRVDPGPRPPTMAEVLAHAARIEATTGRSGAISRTPKQRITDFTDIEKANPSRHFRLINIANTDKAMNGILLGYEPWHDAEGHEIQRGNLKLMSCPAELFDGRKADQAKLTAEQTGYEDDGRRRDSGEFYSAVDAIAQKLTASGHSRNSIRRIIKDNLENVGV